MMIKNASNFLGDHVRGDRNEDENTVNVDCARTVLKQFSKSIHTVFEKMQC